MLPAAAVVVAFQPRLLFGPSRREWTAGSIVDLVCFFGIVLQVWGLADTTPGWLRQRRGDECPTDLFAPPPTAR